MINYFEAKYFSSASVLACDLWQPGGRWVATGDGCPTKEQKIHFLPFDYCNIIKCFKFIPDIFLPSSQIFQRYIQSAL